MCFQINREVLLDLSTTSLQLLFEVLNCCLGHCEREYQLWSDDKDFWDQTLEEGTKPFVLNNVLDNGNTLFRRLEWSVLNTGFDDIQGRSYGN
mmetsp:Transcript_19195/g.31492  ORF Transcript_19195/g.31492 Transcript_19195/m.31492 type:complete len:93 (-) Transcript_19195:879-1157(-)